MPPSTPSPSSKRAGRNRATRHGMREKISNALEKHGVDVLLEILFSREGTTPHRHLGVLYPRVNVTAAATAAAAAARPSQIRPPKPGESKLSSASRLLVGLMNLQAYEAVLAATRKDLAMRAPKPRHVKKSRRSVAEQLRELQASLSPSARQTSTLDLPEMPDSP